VTENGGQNIKVLEMSITEVKKIQSHFGDLGDQQTTVTSVHNIPQYQGSQ